MLLINTIISAGVSYWYMRYVKQTTAAEDDTKLVAEQKGLVPFLIFLNPIVNGLIFYLGWKNKLPRKAKSASNWAVGILTALTLIGFIAIGIIILSSDINLDQSSELGKPQTKLTLSRLIPRANDYYSQSLSYKKFCEEMNSFNLQEYAVVGDIGPDINAQPVLKKAKCLSNESAFAVSVKAKGMSFCADGRAMMNIQSMPFTKRVETGKQATKNPISCSAIKSNNKPASSTEKTPDNNSAQKELSSKKQASSNGGTTVNDEELNESVQLDLKRVNRVDKIWSRAMRLNFKGKPYPETLSQLRKKTDITKSDIIDPKTGNKFRYKVYDDPAKFCVGVCLNSDETPDRHSLECAQELGLSCDSNKSYAIGSPK